MMNFQTLLPAAAGFLSLCLGLVALFRAKEVAAYRFFALGMFLLAAEQAFSLLALRSELGGQFLRWEYFKMLAGGFAPGVWLAFSICYSREDCGQRLQRWKWALLAATVFPAAVIGFFRGWLFSAFYFVKEWIVRFGWPGYLYELSVLVVAILILVTLERTLRASSGAIRWRIKFMLLGIGFIFAAGVYSTAERLLFIGDHSFLFTVDSAALVLADIMVIIALARTRLQDINVYISRNVLYNSIVILIVGSYLLVVGILAKIARYFGAGGILLDDAFLIFIALMGIVVLLLSGSVRFGVRNFVTRHFQRPVYDYRKVWASFTERLPSIIDLQDLCNDMARTVSETFRVDCVSIWVNDEIGGGPVLAGSTHLSLNAEATREREREIEFLALSFRDRRKPMTLDSPARAEGGDSDERIVCCAPLIAKGEFLGIITLGSKFAKEEYTAQDLDLLKIIADQAAGLILNHKLFENLGLVRELEAFQAVSAFFAHDLKNVASTLALTLNNLPLHYDDPEFREDTFKIMSKSVEKIRNMCSRLSPLDRKLELQLSECDLNELVAGTVASLSVGHQFVTALDPVPKALLDPEQIRKVLLNLVLNACESSSNGAEIRIATRREGEHLRLSVTDQGRGMSREFIKKYLFHPFKTTKEGGSGIGLYQSKMIIEAHGGRIEVQSREGRGSTFSVFLPLDQSA